MLLLGEVDAAPQVAAVLPLLPLQNTGRRRRGSGGGHVSERGLQERQKGEREGRQQEVGGPRFGFSASSASQIQCVAVAAGGTPSRKLMPPRFNSKRRDGFGLTKDTRWIGKTCLIFDGLLHHRSARVLLLHHYPRLLHVIRRQRVRPSRRGRRRQIGNWKRVQHLTHLRNNRLLLSKGDYVGFNTGNGEKLRYSQEAGLT